MPVQTRNQMRSNNAVQHSVFNATQRVARTTRAHAVVASVAVSAVAAPSHFAPVRRSHSSHFRSHAPAQASAPAHHPNRMTLRSGRVL
jgi:hypothetical protein